MAGGFIYLLAGADLLVRGAVALARKARVPTMLVALTVVALGTSLPEFLVAIQALVSGYPGILLGNVVGSNIANVLCVVGFTALVYPVASGDETPTRDAAIMVGVSALFTGLCLTTGLTRLAGVVLLIALVGVLLISVQEATRGQAGDDDGTPIEWTLGLPSTLGLILLFIGVGVIGLPIGARLVVDAAVAVATDLGVTETVVGLTIVAFSTSLPELATTLVAAYRKRTDVVLGTVIGSNTFNIVGIMGVSAAISSSTIPLPPRFAVLDLPLMVVAAVLVGLFVWLRRPVGRMAGLVLSAAYVAYVAALFLTNH